MKQGTNNIRQAIIFHPEEGGYVFLAIYYSLFELNCFYNP
jgi:hypothetical protein